MALNRVDLPTFGRPINATTGSTLPTVRAESVAGERRFRRRASGAAARRGAGAAAGLAALAQALRTAGCGMPPFAAVGQHDDGVADAAGGLVTRSFVMCSRATNSPVFLSSQCT